MFWGDYMRWVLHVDMNAFYASVEQAKNPQLAGLPIAVAGDKEKRNGIILTASYEARAFGVKTAMTIGDAKKLCPKLVLIPPDLKSYMRYSMRVMDILKSYSPDVEVFSIDEAWLDVTGCERLFGDAVQIADKIRTRIKKELHITASVGVSYCKLMAKMASDLKKPDATSVIMEEDIETKVWPLPVKDLIGVGRRMETKLNGMGIYTIGELANTPLKVLEKNYGKMGSYLWHFANGIDNSRVSSKEDEIKGISNSITTPRDVCNMQEASEVLMCLCESVGRRVRERGLQGDVIEIMMRTKDFASCIRQRKITIPTDVTSEIHSYAMELLKENWTEEVPLRLLGVRITGLKPALGFRQVSFFEERERIRSENLDKCMDIIREKYGYNSVKRASLMPNSCDKLIRVYDEDEWKPMKTFNKGGGII